MFTLDTIASTKEKGGPVSINCPICRKPGVTAQVEEVHEEYRLLSLIPLWHVSHTFLRCDACRGRLIARVAMGDLYGRTCAELEPLIKARIGILHFISVFCAAMVCWVPVVGLVPSALAVLVNRRIPRWTRLASYITLVLSLAWFGYIAGLYVWYEILKK